MLGLSEGKTISTFEGPQGQCLRVTEQLHERQQKPSKGLLQDVALKYLLQPSTSSKSIALSEYRFLYYGVLYTRLPEIE